MKMNLELAAISQCNVDDCCYNRDKKCHAFAITVGDAEHAGCDTFFRNNRHAAGRQSAGVGACKMGDCVHNNDFECQAKSIEVDRSGDSAECMTYEER